VFLRRIITVIASTARDDGRISTEMNLPPTKMGRVQQFSIPAPLTEVNTQSSSGSGGSTTEDREWLDRPNHVLPPSTAQVVDLVATANHITARIELTPAQAHALDAAVGGAKHVVNPSRSPWVGVIIRTSRGRYVLRRGFCWTSHDAAVDARGVLDALRDILPLELKAEVGRHLYAPLVGDSAKLNEYLW